MSACPFKASLNPKPLLPGVDLTGGQEKQQLPNGAHHDLKEPKTDFSEAAGAPVPSRSGKKTTNNLSPPWTIDGCCRLRGLDLPNMLDSVTSRFNPQRKF